jgi:glycosyltransferase involved in cell wall biosynthesis
VKILQVIDSLKVGGAQKLVAEFARAISTGEHEVEVIVLSRPEPESRIYKTLEDLNVRTEWLQLRTVADMRALFRLKERMKVLGPDIVHTQLNYANIHGTLAADLAGIPAVASLHNASVHLYGYRPYRTWLETYMLRGRSTRIIACGYTVARVQQHRFPHKTLDVIPNPVPDQTEVPQEQVDSIRRKYLPQGKGCLLVSVGRLIPEKGYANLIDALKIVNRESAQKAILLIVGQGYLMGELQEKVDQADMAGEVGFLGERDDVPLLLAASDIYVSASHYEGQSLAVLEAMASGLPVVATDVGDNRRVIAEQCGLVLPAGKPDLMAQEIVRLIDDPQERKRIGTNARKCVREHYSVGKWVERLIGLYDEVLHA